MAEIHIQDLLLRTVIGINEHERNNRQDVIVNISFEYDSSEAEKSDGIEHTVNYREISKKIIDRVENSSFFLVEKLASVLLGIIMENKRVNKAEVKIDKPHALRFAESVSVTLRRNRDDK
ncbi:MAG: dihydroneopterin aldolase [Fibrobacterota bacterium]